MGHISDRTLDNLLDGTIDDASELAIEEHVRHCDRCAHRLREWELLFPQVKSLIPTGEHPIPAGSAAFAAPRGPSVYVPDWTPPRSPRPLPVRIAWGLVILLAAGAGYLLLQRSSEDAPSVAYLPESYEATQERPVDSAGLGSGIPALTDSQRPALDSAQLQQATELIRLRDSIANARLAALQEEARLAAAPPPPAEPAPSEQDVRRPPPDREPAVSFPIRTDQSTARSTPAPATTTSATEALPPLPAQFQRVTLGEAISRLSGTVRLIQGLNPEAVEIAQGSVLPGADPAKAVVRVVYNAPEGRLIMDQQRLGRSGGSEPNIAISTAPNGVSVAQWVDRGGYWISLAGRADQQTLLGIANRIR